MLWEKKAGKGDKGEWERGGFKSVVSKGLIEKLFE